MRILRRLVSFILRSSDAKNDELLPKKTFASSQVYRCTMLLLSKFTISF